MSRKPAPDQAERDAAVRARGVNVLVDAGAGTGKTTLLVARILELVAPEHGGAPVPLERIAAITFTRKAAGELKYRIREALLRALAPRGLPPGRRALLSAALSALDTAHVGTVHGFADRLLRLRPVEARLSPSYEIVDDEAALHAETYDLLMQGVDLGTLADELAGAVARERAIEAEAAIADALRIGLRAVTEEHAYGERTGLDRLFQRLVETRDVELAASSPEPPEPPDMAAFRRNVAELERWAEGATGDAAGSRHLRRLAERLARLARLEAGAGAAGDDRAGILAELLRLEAAEPAKMRKGVEFAEDAGGWAAWRAWAGDDRKNPVRATPLRDDLAGPFHAWMARRLVRCAPVVVAAHERVKRRHRAVDQVDLLLELRNLLRDRTDVRAELQGLFDQILVDEFQDTDPLQAEIVLYLCERGARAASWREVELAPGKLTVVGDPKQSIYRFRRADISVYAEVRAIVQRGPHLEASLQANFRCAPPLIAWLNDRFDRILGADAKDGRRFDPDTGTVVNVPLLAGRSPFAFGPPGGRDHAQGERERDCASSPVAASASPPAPAVVTLPLVAPDDAVDHFRAAEARALATFLRATVDGRARRVVDPVTAEERPVRFGDVAILTAATTKLPLLFPELDRLGIPYAVRGSRLFLEDALHRQFLLALRFLADPQDGVARAALFRAPFFALDLDDLARERAAAAGSVESTDAGVARVRAARELVDALRRERLLRAPGETARELLERTAFARAVALGPNGAQRLDGLHELCLRLDALAAEEGLDFDGATQRTREWVVAPIELDPPRPVGAGAVQILSVHQAKGLEFPVVALWDACAKLAARDDAAAFAVDRDGRSWALKLDGFAWSEPDDRFAARERAYRDAERLRVVYVAATRARDLLVLPVARIGKGGPHVNGTLAEGAPSALVEPLAPYALEDVPAWAESVAPPAPPPPGDASALAGAIAARWRDAVAVAAPPRAAPTSVTAEAHRQADAEEDAGGRAPRASRFGPVFGETVHRAIGLALADPALSPAGAVARAAAGTGLAERRAEAAEDVARALDALDRAGLRRPPGPDLRLEYPVARRSDDGAWLVQGYLDLVGRCARDDEAGEARLGRLAVVDFKTDAPPAVGGDVRVTHAAYVAQVRAYARMLAELGLAAPGSVRAALLFTADGGMRWVA